MGVNSSMHANPLHCKNWVLQADFAVWRCRMGHSVQPLLNPAVATIVVDCVPACVMLVPSIRQCQKEGRERVQSTLFLYVNLDHSVVPGQMVRHLIPANCLAHPSSLD